MQEIHTACRASFRTARRIEILSIAVIWLSISFFYLLFALNVWPPLDSDALAYIPHILQYANNHKLLNCVWSPLYGPETRLVYHGFLFQMLIGSLIRPAAYRSIIFIIAIINAITLACLAFIFYRIISGSKLSSFRKVSIVGSGMLGISTLINGLVGRPETFALLVVSLLICGLITTDKRRHWIFFGLSIGILVCSHTIGAILLTVLFIAYLSSRFDRKEFMLNLVLALGLALVVITICFLWYPYSLVDWVKGNFRNSLLVVWSYWRANIFLYWFIMPDSFLFGLIFIISLSCAVYLYRCFKSVIKIKWLFFCSTFISLVLIYYFGIRVPTMSYNIRLFAPLIYSVILYTYILWEQRGKSRGQKYKKTLVTIALIIILIFCSFGFLREIILLRENIRNGISYNEARNFLQDFRSRNNGLIMLSVDLFSLTEDYNNIVVGLENDITTLKPDYILLQQAYWGRLFPSSIPGYIIIRDFYCKIPPRLLGIRIGSVNRGYDFAVYQRENK